MQIEYFVRNIHNNIYIVGKYFKNKEDYLPIPEAADIIDVYSFYNMSELQCWYIKKLKRKYVLFPKFEKFVGFPLLHVEK